MCNEYDMSPELVHGVLLDQEDARLKFRKGQDFAVWKQKVHRQLGILLGDTPELAALDIRVEYDEQKDQYREMRYVFTSEANADVPVHLLVPKGEGPFPVLICLQGHTSGMHISLGRPKSERDEESVAGGRDFALQAVAEGYAALVIENRAFGERSDQRPDNVRSGHHGGCHHASMVSLLLGRTIIGERIWDVSRALDTLEELSDPALDLQRIGCMGNSGGGTVTYFAACMEDRIKAVMPSCYVCGYRYSIGRIDHCQCNYIPGFLKYFDLPDLAGLIAPRSLVLIAGQEDPIFPIDGVRLAFEKILDIYEAAGHRENVVLEVGDGGHRFYPEKAWPAFRALTKW